MKKKVFLALLVSSLSLANFLDGMQEIDRALQKNDYKKAYIIGQDLLKEDLSSDDREVLMSILEEIDAKIPKTGEISVKLNVETPNKKEVFQAISKNDFNKMKEYENEILKSANPLMINEYAKLYIKSGLIESAASLALKDESRNVKNIYLAATALRMLGEYDKSISLYKEVLSKDANKKALLGIGLSYKMKKDYGKAIKYLTNYLEFDNSPEIQNEINVLKTLE